MEKKKRGRPSLLDLQKRSLKQQQPQEQHQHPRPNHSQDRNPNPNQRTSPIPTRRSTRRNPNPDAAEDDDKEEFTRLRSGKNSSSLNSAPHASDSNPEDEFIAASHKKRKINAVVGGSAHENTKKEEKLLSCTNSTSNQQGTLLDSGSSTPLPDKKFLASILERLQKKDTYGVFSEPVDPKELPDYHEMIEHPMDFGTVKKKLDTGVYAHLEGFEKDVLLICSNAMQYNSADTIFFRQARSIQELAKKNFENLRQCGDDSEPEPRIVRRGRPPTKNIKKPLGRPPLERAGSEFSSDAITATGGDGSLRPRYDLRKGPVSDKNGSADLSERVFHGSCKNEAYASWLAEQKLERNEEFTGSKNGSLVKGHTVKHWKKEFVLDENRRNTYKQFHPSPGGQKQLMAVGLLTEFGYATSLARFAATLGPLAWRIASRRIESSLPAGLKFGPGWVGQNEAVPKRMSLLSPPSSGQLSQFWPLPQTGNSCSAATCSTVEIKEIESSERTEGDNPSATLPSGSIPTTSISEDRSFELRTGSKEAAKELMSRTGFSNTNSAGSIRIQYHQNSATRPGMNGVNGTYGFKLPSQMGKKVGAMNVTGFNLQSSTAMADNLSLNEPKLSENSSKMNFDTSFPNLGREKLVPERAGLLEQLPLQRMDSVPPDLNVIFQSQGESPSTRVELIQPDLALQL